MTYVNLWKSGLLDPGSHYTEEWFVFCLVKLIQRLLLYTAVVGCGLPGAVIKNCQLENKC